MNDLDTKLAIATERRRAVMEKFVDLTAEIERMVDILEEIACDPRSGNGAEITAFRNGTARRKFLELTKTIGELVK